MIINYTDEQDSRGRNEKIKATLPKQSIISAMLEPELNKRLYGVLAKCIRAELEIYRAYPKKVKENEPVAEMEKTFDPRNNDTCFMGKAFKANKHITDSELSIYRKAIGTVNHPVWGDCTLLEIWGGDHFEEHNKMVVNAFRYGMNLTNTCPAIKVFVNPLFKNENSKEFKLSKAQKEYQDDMEMLMAKAMIFGVRTPKEAQKERQRKPY